MAEAYRGLKIKFSADAKTVMQAVRGMSSAAANLNSELKMVQKALRFDPGNAKVVATQMNLLREKASTADAMVRQMRRHFAELGNVKFNGQSMRELSARTRDASTNASLARTRYNELTEQLNLLHKQAKKAWGSAVIDGQKNPFKGKQWSDLPTQEIQQYIEKMRQAGLVTDAEANRMASAVGELRPAFHVAQEELEKLDKTAQYQSFGNKIELESAKVKQAVREMNAAWEASPVTRYTEQVERAKTTTRSLESEVTRLKEAIKLDPSNYQAVIAAQDRMKTHAKALVAENEKLNAEMRELAKIPGVKELVADFNKLQSEEAAASEGLERLGTELVKAEGRATELADKINKLKIDIAKSPPEVEKLTAELEQAEAEQRQVTAAVERTNAEYEEMGRRMQTVTAANAYRGLNDATIANTAAMNANIAATQKAHKTRTVAFHAMKSLGMSAYMTITPAAMMLGQYAVQSADEIDAAYRNMRKTVDGTEEQFEALRQSALKFGDTHFTSADQILQIQALGGQLGIAAEDLDKFAETVSNIDVATDLDTETIALKLGQLSNILKLSKDDWEGFSDALVRLGNNSPTLESNIMNVMSRISPMGAIVKMSADQLLGWSTAVASTGQNSEAAGTAIARTMSQIEQAVAAGTGGMDAFTDAAGMSYQAWMELYNSGDTAGAASVISNAINGNVEALETLAASCEMTSDEFLEAFEGDAASAMDTLAESVADSGERLQGFAEVAGMSADEFAKLWGSDASSAMEKFIGGLKRIDDEGGSVDATLGNLKINAVRQKQALEGLTTTYDILRDSLQMSKDAMNGVSDRWGAAGDAAREAARKAEGFSGALQMLKNTGQHFASILGEELAPVIKNLAVFLADMADGAQNASPALKKLVLGITGLLIASGPALTMLTSIGTAMDNYRSHAERLASVQTRMSKMNSGVTASMSKLNAKYIATTKALSDFREKQNKAIASGTQLSAAELKQGRALERTEKRLYAVGKAARFAAVALKTVGAALALAAVFAAVDKIKQLHDEMVTFDKGTRGLVESASNLTKSVGDFSASEEGATANTRSFIDQLLRLNSASDEQAQKNAELAASFNNQRAELSGTEAELDYYAGVIQELAGNCNGSAEKLALLKEAVARYNEIAGTSYEVTNDYSGAINTSTEAFKANTEAIKANLKVKAIESLMEDSYKQQAELKQEVTKAEEAFTAAQEESRKAQEAASNAIGWSRNGVTAYEQAVTKASVAEADAKATLDELKKEQASVDESIALLTADLETETAAQAEANKKAQEAIDTLDEYRSSVEGVGPSFDEMVETIRAAAEASGQDVEALGLTAEGLYEKLQQANIGVDQFAQLGTEAFARLYQEANYDINGVVDALNLANAFNLDPKTLHVTEDGIADTEGRLWTFDQNAEAWFANGIQVHVGDDGTVDLEGQKVEGLKGNIDNLPNGNYTISDGGSSQKAIALSKAVIGGLGSISNTRPAYKVDDHGTSQKSVMMSTRVRGALNAIPKTTSTTINSKEYATAAASSARAALNRIDGKSVSTYIHTYEITHKQTKNEGGSASGGFSPAALRAIPMHADGGLAGIVRSATLTNYGWVGEDGAEAIIPLDNPRYVRPFAQAVANAMGDASGEQVYVTNVYVNNARVNDDPQILAVTKDYLKTLHRKGLMR